ncbi:MAG: HAD family phosphatase [Candidatus Omnitrophica bacterium]|nr:HAD family phosphatase [Candidatus Omnitrophota bacterium]
MLKVKSRFRAIIFDMDGVIVDSMPYHYLAWYEALMPYGIRVSCFDVYSKEGERWEKTLRELFLRSGIKVSDKLFKKIFLSRKKIFRKYFKRFIFPGAQEFLVCLKNKGYLLGLVTGTPEAEIKKILPSSIKVLFDCIIAGDKVKKGKPDPEPYLRAAKALKTKAGLCAVVENAPLGIESAKRAGMFCIALTTSLPRQYLSRADALADRLDEITAAVDKSCVLKRKRLNL